MIAKLADDNPCKPVLIAMLESLEKIVKDFKDGEHEEDVWQHIQPNYDDITQYYMRQLIGEFILNLSMEYTDYGSEFYGVSKGHLFLDAIVDDACREYATSVGMSTDVQTFLESLVAIAYERVGGAGPSKEFEEPQVDLMFDLTHQWPSYTSPEVMKCPDMTLMDSFPKSVLRSHTHDPTTSPLGLKSRQANEDLEDGDRIQHLRHEIDVEDIVPPRDSISS
eukprot:Gb_22697 [translate_table: standard]